jgi:predicted RNA binding protein with dsRBD fold (UPF0201 family)
MIVPSCYLAYKLFQEKKYSERVEQFINQEFVDKGYTIIFQRSNFRTKPKTLELAFLSKNFTKASLDSLQQQLAAYNIADTKLEIRQHLKDIKGEMLNKAGNQNKNLIEQNMRIQLLQQTLSEYTFDNTQVLKEIAILFPEIKQASLGRHNINQQTDSAKSMIVLLYQLQEPKVKLDTVKLERWLQENLQTKDINIVRAD